MKSVSIHPCIPGKFYLVPCVQGSRLLLGQTKLPAIPCLGVAHSDRDLVNAVGEHYHIDWRFIPDAVYNAYVSASPIGSVMGVVLDIKKMMIKGLPQLRWRKCRRAMPDFPSIKQPAWAMLQDRYRACRLLDAGRCPHKGIDVRPFEKPDGTAICPGHGLRWDLSTGRMILHHGTAEADYA